MSNSEPEEQKGNPQEEESTQQQEKPAADRREARKKRVEKIIRYLGWSVFGLGGFGTIGSLVIAGNYQAALLSALLTIAATFLAIAYKFVSGVTKRQVPSKNEFILDETATVEQIAEEKLLLPVMSPAPERWLELALVVDEGASMMLWKQTIKEFEQLLERHGAFGDVRSWGLFLSEDNKVWLRSKTG